MMLDKSNIYFFEVINTDPWFGTFPIIAVTVRKACFLNHYSTSFMSRIDEINSNMCRKKSVTSYIAQTKYII